MAYVTVRIKGQEGYHRVALGKDRNIVGRLSGNEVPIKHSSMSREHCAIIKDGDGWALEDLGSSNGTRLNRGERISGRVKLTEKDIIKAGSARLTFHAGSIDAPAEAAIDLKLDDEDGASDGSEAAAARDPDTPPEAMKCPACGTWLSFAHRSAGDRFACARCGAQATVPAVAG